MLIVAPRLEIGGAEMHLARLLPRLRQSGLDISLFTISKGGPVDAELEKKGIEVLGPAASGGRVLASLRTALALRREMGRLHPSIVHFFLPEPYLVGSLAAFGHHGIIKIMSRRSLSHYQRNHPMLARLERRLHRSVVALIGNSNAVADQLAEESGRREKVGVIHNGVELPSPVAAETRAEQRCAHGIPLDAFVMATIANFIPYKGHADLFSALGAIRGRLCSPWRLMLIGRDEGIVATLQQQAEQLGIADNILWLGERADAQELLAAADLGVLPSHHEGFSNSLIEKMAHGLPVIATRVGGNIDAVSDGETGRLVPVSDAAALSEAIVSLYQDAELRSRMGAAARLRIEELFSLDACSGRYLNLYRGLMEGRTLPIAQLIDPLAPGISASSLSPARAVS